jgi:hypothetical protein
LHSPEEPGRGAPASITRRISSRARTTTTCSAGARTTTSSRASTATTESTAGVNHFSCGGGRDVVYTNAASGVSRDCEIVHRAKSTTPPPKPGFATGDYKGDAVSFSPAGDAKTISASGGTASGTFEVRTTLGAVSSDTGSVSWNTRHQ